MIYISLPTNLWYRSLSDSFTLHVIDRPSTRLHFNIPVSAKKSRIYFLWDIKIHFPDCNTSIPRKYFWFPMSFISNSSNKFFLRLFLSSVLFPVIIMSLMYKIKQVIWVPNFFKNNVWSELLYLYTYFFIAMVNWSNHARSDYFNPYIDFFSRHTSPSRTHCMYPYGTSI